MKKIICTLLIFCVLAFNFTSDIKANDIIEQRKLYSLSAAVIDGDTGRVLYEKNGCEIRPMASTTKIMTLILALEYGDVDSYVTVSGYAAKMPKVRLGIKETEQYKLLDLLYAMMLESYNDCAVAIAEHISGSVEQFAALMNQKAYALGLHDTYFITPNGLDAKADNKIHSTNALELARLMKYCISSSEKKDAFINICKTKSYTFSDYFATRKFTVTNKNKLLYDNSDVIAGKTGFTANAGYCYVVAIQKEDSFIVIALLGCGWPPNKSYKWQDVNLLWSAIQDGYKKRKVIYKNDFDECISIYDGYSYVPINVCILEDVSLLLKASDCVKIKTDYTKWAAPIKKGEMIGIITVTVNDEIVKTISCYAEKTVNKRTYQSFLSEILDRFFLY